jgi:predicted DNA-binding transcriptional regulator AlpA
MTTANDRANDRHVDLAWVCWKTGLRRKTIMGDGTPERPGMVFLGTFPEPAHKGPHRNSKWYWWESDILRWMEEQCQKYPYKRPVPANDNREPPANDNKPEKDKLAAALFESGVKPE